MFSAPRSPVDDTRLGGAERIVRISERTAPRGSVTSAVIGRRLPTYTDYPLHFIDAGWYDPGRTRDPEDSVWIYQPQPDQGRFWGLVM